MTSLLSKRGLINPILCVIALLCFGSPTIVKAETVYFLVGQITELPTPSDSYVLPLDDPCDIVYARKLIDEGPLGPNTIAYIVLATIDLWDPNHGINYNRDHLQPGIPAWSWYITEFHGFQKTTAEILDGIPDGVEEDVERWLQYTGGYIGFWSYSVIAELGTDLEPRNCDLTVDGMIDLYDLAWFTSHWLDSTCGHRYYCMGTDIDGSGKVNFYDFAILARNWLWEEQH